MFLLHSHILCFTQLLKSWHSAKVALEKTDCNWLSSFLLLLVHKFLIKNNYFFSPNKEYKINLSVQGERKNGWRAWADLADAAFSSWFHHAWDSAWFCGLCCIVSIIQVREKTFYQEKNNFKIWMFADIFIDSHIKS